MLGGSIRVLRGMLARVIGAAHRVRAADERQHRGPRQQPRVVPGRLAPAGRRGAHSYKPTERPRPHAPAGRGMGRASLAVVYCNRNHPAPPSPRSQAQVACPCYDEMSVTREPPRRADPARPSRTATALPPPPPSRRAAPPPTWRADRPSVYQSVYKNAQRRPGPYSGASKCARVL